MCDGKMPPSLYLIDAWVSVSESYEERLSLLNHISEPWVSVLIPWNNQDAGLSAQKTIFGSASGCTWAGNSTACRVVAGWRPMGSRRCRISFTSCLIWR